MRYSFFFFYALLYAINGLGQIKTPSFANYNICPYAFGQISFSAGWRQPTFGTCDYFNKCSASPSVSVPGNYFGYQDNAIHAYAGLYTILSSGDYKEYIATAIPKLAVGNTYTMSITVSLSDSSNVATDGLGVLFSTTPRSYSIIHTIPVVPQIDFSSYGPITDKVNWVTLTGSFVADSAYTHLIVGCFKRVTSLVIDSIPGSPVLYGRVCYYYIGEIGISDSTYFGDSTYGPPIDTTTPPVDTTKPPVPDTADYVFPNAFTPNGDGVNDVFRISGKAYNHYKGFMLRVYNRWGECVFMSNDPNQGWDGTHIGQRSEFGVYFYYAEFGLNNEQHLAKGDVTLIR